MRRVEEPARISKQEPKSSQLNMSEQWQKRVELNMAKLHEEDIYQEVVRCIEFPCKELGCAAPGSFPSAKEPIPGEDEFVQMFGKVQQDRRNYKLQVRRDEEEEEQLVNTVIQAEIAYNFPNYASWAHREGTTSARRRLEKFEDKLWATGAELRELRKKRTELRLNTRDMVERLKSHHRLESLTE